MRPPRPSEREQKTRMSSFKRVMALMGIFGMATEAGDFIEAIWRALPKGKKRWSFYKGKPVKPPKWKMLRDLFDNHEHINIPRAINNYMQMQMQDRVIGALSSSRGLSTNHAMKFQKQLEEEAKKAGENRQLRDWWKDLTDS